MKRNAYISIIVLAVLCLSFMLLAIISKQEAEQQSKIALEQISLAEKQKKMNLKIKEEMRLQTEVNILKIQLLELKIDSLESILNRK